MSHSIKLQAPLNHVLATFPATEQILTGLGFDIVTDREKPLDEVCRSNKLDPETFAAMLLAFLAAAPAPRIVPAELMNVSALCDHIVNVQHGLVYHELERLNGICREIDALTEVDEPQLALIQKQFNELREQLTRHLTEEAEVLFPRIRQLDNDRRPERGALDRLKAPMAQMKHDHDKVDEVLDTLEAMTDIRSSSPSTSALLRNLHEAVQRLEGLLHEQIYQENQIVFRRVLARAASDR